MEADAQLDAAQRVDLRLQPPPYGAAAASGGAVHAGFRHPAPVLPAEYRRSPRSGRNGYFNFGDNLEASFPRDGFQFNNKTNWIKGRHGIQFGAEFEYLRPEIYNDFRRAGHFISNGQFTRAPGAASGGHALADFLLGRLNTFDHGTGEYKNYRNLYQSYFFQDDFKISDRVTLNFGARYEPTGPWHDLVGRFQYSTWTRISRASGRRSTANAPPGLFYRGDPGVPEDGTKPDRNNVSGRFGFAWDVTGDGRTSIRGGGGMFYDTHLQGDYNNGGVNAPPWSIRVNVVDSPSRWDRCPIPIARAPTSTRSCTTTRTRTRSSAPRTRRSRDRCSWSRSTRCSTRR